MIFVNLFEILTRYHAVIAVSRTIPATEKTVMKAEFRNACRKSD